MAPQAQVKRSEELPVALSITLVQPVSFCGKEIRLICSGGCNRKCGDRKVDQELLNSTHHSFPKLPNTVLANGDTQMQVAVLCIPHPTM